MIFNLANLLIELKGLEEYSFPFILFQVREKATPPEIVIFPDKKSYRFILSNNTLLAKGGEDWKIYRAKGKIIFLDNCNSSGRMIIFDRDIKKGEFYPGENKNKFEDFENPLLYPLGPLILSHKLAQKGEGVFLHSGGVLEDNCGYLFVGHPEVGKTTLVELWKKENPEAIVLHDERIILRKIDKDFYAYGCPWHLKKPHLVSNKTARIKFLFFLKQSKKNYLRSLDRKESYLRILQHSFYPAYDLKLMENSLDFLRNLIEKIPSFELGFIPTPSVIAFLRKHLDI